MNLIYINNEGDETLSLRCGAVDRKFFCVDVNFQVIVDIYDAFHFYFFSMKGTQGNLVNSE